MYFNYILNQMLDFALRSTPINWGIYVTHSKGHHSEELGFSTGGGESLFPLIPKA